MITHKINKYLQNKKYKSNKKKRLSKKNNKLKGGSNNKVHHGSPCSDKNMKQVKNSEQGYLVICKKGKKIPFTKRMLKTSLYTNKNTKKNKSKYFKKIHKDYKICLKKPCWHKLSKSNEKRYDRRQKQLASKPTKQHRPPIPDTNHLKRINKIAKSLPNMFNNSSACYANVVLQLLFRLDEFNKQILELSNDDLQGIDGECFSYLLNYKKLLELRDEAKRTNKKIDQKNSKQYLRNLGHTGNQEDSGTVLDTLLGFIIANDEHRSVIGKIIYQLFEQVKTFCEDRTDIEKIKDSFNFNINLIYHDNRKNSIQNLLDNYSIKQTETTQDIKDTGCTVKDPYKFSEVLAAVRRFRDHYNQNTEFSYIDKIRNPSTGKTESIEVKTNFQDYFTGTINVALMNDISDENPINFEQKKNDIEDLYNALSSSKLNSIPYIKTNKLILFNRLTKRETINKIVILDPQKYILISVNHRNSENLELNDELTFRQADKEVKFKLIGFTAYKGFTKKNGTTKGHYISYINRDNVWFRLDDLEDNLYAIPVRKYDCKKYDGSYKPHILAYERI